MQVIKAPEYPEKFDEPYIMSIFLGGSIDMGQAIDWQSVLTDRLQDLKGLIVFNPRRDDWDSSWEQSINNPKFKEQVEWELSHLEAADVAASVFDPKGPAPITLMELGMRHKKEKMWYYQEQDVVVLCPYGYWRKGNVDIVCEKYELDQVSNMDDLEKYIRDKFTEVSNSITQEDITYKEEEYSYYR